MTVNSPVPLPLLEGYCWTWKEREEAMRDNEISVSLLGLMLLVAGTLSVVLVAAAIFVAIHFIAKVW